MDVKKIVEIYRQHVESLNEIEYKSAAIWYAEARSSIVKLALIVGTAPTKTIEAVAGFNQCLSWEQSLVESTAFLIDPICYRRLGRNKFMYYLQHGTVSGSRKLEDFFCALLGVENSVPIDRHMHVLDGSLTDNRYRLYQSAVYRVAETFKLAPSNAQAVIWCGIRKAKGLPFAGGSFEVNSVIDKAYTLLQNLNKTALDV